MSAALIAGAAMGGPAPRLPLALGAIVLLTAIAWRTRRLRAVTVVLLAGAAWGAGAAVQRIAWRRHAQVEALLFAGAPRAERELRARVLSCPERLRNGERSMRLDAILGSGFPPARLLLTIATPEDRERERLDGLRRGDEIVVWCALRAPRAGPLGPADAARRRLLADRLDAEGRVKSSRLVRRLTPGDASVGRAIDRAHAAAIARFDASLDPAGRSRAVLGAMLLGDRALLDDDDNAILRDAGLVHIISISGLHTALTVVVLLALARRAGIGPAGRAASGAVLLPALAALVGDGAAVWRACGLLGITLLARVTGRDVDPLAALASSSALLVLLAPALAWNVGFILSVTATAGLIVGLERCPPPAGSIARSLHATTGAYAATLPIVARVFGRAAPAALVANLVAAPLCAACMGGGLLVLLLGRSAAWLAEVSVQALFAVARGAAALPCAHLRVASPPLIVTGLYALALVALAYGPRRRIASLATFLLALAIHLGPLPVASGHARADVLDVGQGLAVLLEGAEGDVSLYDAGPAGEGRLDAGDRIVVPHLAAIGCRRLRVLAISHDHDDHAGGAFAVLRDREVGELWLAAGTERDPLTRDLAAAAVARGVAVRRLTRGEELRAGSWLIDVLHPASDDRRRPVNDRCLALRARAPTGSSILLPGDLEAAGERSLLEAGSVAAEALVASHHGSDGSSTLAFVRAVAPRVVVVSVGAGNRFGHPGVGALRRLASGGASIYRTDQCGAVTLEASSTGWRISEERDRRSDEREEEDHPQHDPDQTASPTERLAFVEETGMPPTQNEQNDEPERITGRHAGPHGVADHPDGESRDRGPRDDEVRSR